MHHERKVKLQAIRGQQCRGDMFIGKTAVLGMLDRDSREIRAKVVPNVRRETLQNEILRNIEYGSKVYTDAAITYIIGKTYIHEVVNMLRSTCADKFTRTGWRTSGACSSATCAGLT